MYRTPAIEVRYQTGRRDIMTTNYNTELTTLIAQSSIKYLYTRSFKVYSD